MSLLGRSIFAKITKSAPRRTKVFRPALQPYLEGLEQRTVLSAPGAAMVAAAAVHSAPLSITGVNVTNLQVSPTVANTLLATVNLTGTLNTVSGPQAFTLPNLQVPITLTPAPGSTTILHLSLQIPDLNLLGLHVRLDNCNNGPVTVDITAQPGEGLLGDLLGGLLGGGSLGSIGLSPANSTELTGILNGILTDLVAGNTNATGGSMDSTAGTTDTIPAGDTELVDLHVGAIHANILGLHVDTSQICLNLYADPNGGLLGGLLSSLDNLLNNGGNTGHAQGVLVRNILRDLGRLGL